MAVEAYLPTLGVVSVTAAVDSINPCAIGVLILLISVLLVARKSVGRMLFLGGLYIFTVFSIYLLAGLGLTYFLAGIPLWLTEYISIIVGLLIVFAGILEIKDFFWYGEWISLTIPYKYSKEIERGSKRTRSALGVMFFGAFVALVELPCTGAPYLAIITLLSQYFDFTAFMLLVLYNFIFVAPLIIILILIASGKKLYKIHKWKQETKGFIRLAVGLILVAMGWLLILIANGTINLG
ncbi:hypothetical protein HY498_04335 [Candidatus Woesearchaeota archaeon]|nr:hypothetical protein [Candidatus Woesearchaeota archaeon]